MLTWINAWCDVGLGLPKCQAMHPTPVLRQKAKYSPRVNVVRCCSNNRRAATGAPCPFRANKRHKAEMKEDAN